MPCEPMRRYCLAIQSALALTILGPVCLVAPAADWFQWRGPNRDGHSPDTGLRKQWPPQGPPLLWKATGLGRGYSGVAVRGNRLYTLGDKGDTSYLLALNATNGAIVWSVPVGKAGAPGWGGYAGPRATPTAAGELVIAVDQWGSLVCVDSTGKELWRCHYERDLGGRRPEWGFAESPLVDGDRVVVTPGGPRGALAALDAKTGLRLWRSKQCPDQAQYASVIVAEIGGVRQYIQLTMDHVLGVAAADGRLLWQAPRKGRTAVIPTPIYSDSHVYVTSGYGVGCNLFKITARDGQFQATQLYANTVMANHHGGVVKVGDYLYGHSEGKGWVCQNFLTGTEVWTENSRLGKGSIAYADGLLICREETAGVVALVEATPEGYREKGRFTQPSRSKEKSWPHPVISGGKLYLRDQDLLLCYELRAN